MNKLMARALSQAASSSRPTKWSSRASYSIPILHQPPSSYALYSTVPTTTSLKKYGLKNKTLQQPDPTSPPSADPEPGQACGVDEKPQPKLTEAAKMEAPGTWPRPSEIRWQAKVANSVNLIGTVQVPVHFQASGSDDKYYASTIISSGPSEPRVHRPLRIQVTFQGDLAHIAACHLKEKDCIHVGGQLSRDSVLLNPGKLLTDIQVLVTSLNFVQQSSVKKTVATETAHATMTKEKMDSGFDASTKFTNIDSADDSKKDAEPTSCPWENLFENTQQWLDFRDKKLSGLLKSGHPDFKSKDGKPLWLTTAPNWVLSELEKLNFKSKLSGLQEMNSEPKDKYLKFEASEDLWKSCVENPDNWWDNRFRKTNPKYPDFKHKTSGEALWLNSAPAWVQSKLPPVKTMSKDAAWKEKALLS